MPAGGLTSLPPDLLGKKKPTGSNDSNPFAIQNEFLMEPKKSQQNTNKEAGKKVKKAKEGGKKATSKSKKSGFDDKNENEKAIDNQRLDYGRRKNIVDTNDSGIFGSNYPDSDDDENLKPQKQSQDLHSSMEDDNINSPNTQKKKNNKKICEIK